MSKKIAVILCGSGYKDGSEIRESVGALWALSKHGFEVQCFAPNEPQAHVVNSLTGKESAGENRNQLVEAARIARGKILPLTELNPSQFDGVVIPGGFGAAKNLCNYAFKGTAGTVHGLFNEKLHAFHSAKKPIGAICIAPMIVAMAFKNANFELTEGAEGGAAEDIRALGHKHVATQPNQIHVDLKNKIVTTPAYMYDDAPLHEIFEGIEKLVLELKKML